MCVYEMQESMTKQNEEVKLTPSYSIGDDSVSKMCMHTRSTLNVQPAQIIQLKTAKKQKNKNFLKGLSVFG